MPWGTDTLVAIDLIHTSCPEGTRRRLTLIDVYSAIWPGKTRRTLAPVPVVSIHAGATVVAGMRAAVIGILGTDGPLPAFFAHACEGLAVDHTGAPIMAGVGQAATIPGYVAGCSFPATRTHALKCIPFVIAGTAIVARGLITLAVTRVAGLSFPPVFAVTVEVVDQVSARAPVVAGVLAAVINIGFTVGPLPAIATDALVGVDAVDAGAAILTGVALAVVDIFMAVCSREAFVTVTGEFASRLTLALPVGTTDVRGNIPHPFRRVVGRHGHCAAVNHFTRGRAAVVFQVRAVLALIVFRALAEVVAGTVVALGTVLAGIGLTIIYVELTEVSRETSGTQTLESVDFILTVTPIQTGVAGTFIDVFLTVVACIARWTDAAVTIHQIPTGGVILTLAKAVIDIYVTVLTHPAGKAVTVVAGNQILTGFGIYTRFGLTFICI